MQNDHSHGEKQFIDYASAKSEVMGKPRWIVSKANEDKEGVEHCRKLCDTRV